MIADVLARVPLLLALASMSCAQSASRDVEVAIERHALALSSELPQQVHATLARIDGLPRQLLALRAYLRADDRLAARWSWSEAEIEAFKKTPEYREIIAEVRRVQTRFEAENRGYTLYANTQVRSLDTQVERWNTNASVARVAQALQRASEIEMRASSYPKQPNEASIERFAKFLADWRVPHAPALAAPGLSAHGQLKAIDFAVFKNEQIVAPTTLTSADEVWHRQGWSAKLKRATEGTRFVGPLESPDEPWHYEYAPRLRGSGKQAGE